MLVTSLNKGASVNVVDIVIEEKVDIVGDRKGAELLLAVKEGITGEATYAGPGSSNCYSAFKGNARQMGSQGEDW